MNRKLQKKKGICIAVFSSDSAWFSSDPVAVAKTPFEGEAGQVLSCSVHRHILSIGTYPDTEQILNNISRMNFDQSQHSCQYSTGQISQILRHLKQIFLI